MFMCSESGISNSRDVYIGSANNDWKSLTQVKELGIYLVNCPKIANSIAVYFGNPWKLASLNVIAYTTTKSIAVYFDNLKFNTILYNSEAKPKPTPETLVHTRPFQENERRISIIKVMNELENEPLYMKIQ